MNHSTTHVKAAGHELAAAAAGVSEDVGSVMHAVADGARSATHQARKVAGRVVEAVEEKCGQVGHAARDAFDHGRDRARHWENSFEKTVAARPLVSLLIAAGVGVVVGALWRCRR